MTDDATSRRMRATRSSGSTLELAMRRELTLAGLRYRLQFRPEPDMRHRADFVFIRPRVIVDLRGCYWHGCEAHCIPPKRNAPRWQEKFAHNRARDRRIVKELESRGWTVIVVWEHDDLRVAASVVARVVRNRRTRAANRGSGRRSSFEA
nr:very short patch repair endonuclease [Agromyces luteolus]